MTEKIKNQLNTFLNYVNKRPDKEDFNVKKPEHQIPIKENQRQPSSIDNASLWLQQWQL